jgi:hypothetical protein
MPLTDSIRTLIVRELEGFTREIALFPDDESLWRVAPGISNSAGTLALHVAGNLQHFVGAVLGGTGYVRDRQAEFSTRGWTRQRVAHELQAAIAAIDTTLPGVGADVLAGLYPSAPNGLVVRTEMFLLHLVAHAAFHLGQAGYIRRVVTGDATSANPLPLTALSDPQRG